MAQNFADSPPAILSSALGSSQRMVPTWGAAPERGGCERSSADAVSNNILRRCVHAILICQELCSNSKREPPAQYSSTSRNGKYSVTRPTKRTMFGCDTFVRTRSSRCTAWIVARSVSSDSARISCARADGHRRHEGESETSGLKRGEKSKLNMRCIFGRRSAGKSEIIFFESPA